MLHCLGLVQVAFEIEIGAFELGDQRVGASARSGGWHLGGDLADRSQWWLVGVQSFAELPGERGVGEQGVACGGFLCRLESLESDVFELGLHRRAGVELHGQQTQRLVAVIVVVRDLGDELAVHAQREFAALSDEVIFVPCIEPEIVRPGLKRHLFRVLRTVMVEHGAFALQREIVAPEFVVETYFPRLKVVVVHLIPSHVAVGQPAAPELKTAVDGRRIRAAQPEGELQFEVVQHPTLPNEILIQLRCVLGGNRSGDRPVFDRPEGHVRPLPAVQGAAVEDRLEIVSGQSVVGDVATHGERGQEQEGGVFHASNLHGWPPGIEANVFLAPGPSGKAKALAARASEPVRFQPSDQVFEYNPHNRVSMEVLRSW